MTDLRAQIRAALDAVTCPHVADYYREHGIHVEPCGECQLDAIMAVVEASMWRAANLNHGRCRYCGQGDEPSSRHRMYCRHYVGSIEHHWVGRRYNGTFGGFDHECCCGRSVRVGGIAGSDGPPACPDAAVNWRGPRPVEVTQ